MAGCPVRVLVLLIGLTLSSPAVAEQPRDLAVGGFQRVLCLNVTTRDSCLLGEELTVDTRWIQAHAGFVQGLPGSFNSDTNGNLNSSTLASDTGNVRLGWSAGLDAGSRRYWFRSRKRPSFSVAISARGSFDFVMVFSPRSDGSPRALGFALVSTHGPEVWLAFGSRMALTLRAAPGVHIGFVDDVSVRFAIDVRAGFVYRF